MKRILLAFSLFVAVSNVASVDAGGSFSVVDDRGVEVAFPRTPERVVSLVPSVTEVIFALGAQAKLVGVTTFCDYPPEAKLKPKVGDFSNPSLERISSLQPEVVFATTPEQNSTINSLENLGVKVFSIQPESVDGILRSIENTAKILSTRIAADSLVRRLRSQLEYVSTLVQDVEPKEVYVEIAENPLVTATDGSFVGELVTLAGGTSIAEGAKPYVVMNPERVVGKDPAVIIIAHPASTPEQVKARIGWDSITAVRKNRVYTVDANLVLRPGPRIVQAVLQLLEKIHPDLAVRSSH